MDFWDKLPRLQLLSNLLSIYAFMAKWGRNCFHKFRDKIAKQRALVNSLAEKTDEAGIQKYFEEKEKLHDILLHEEVYWK